MKRSALTTLAALTAGLIAHTVQASEGRYQAYRNGQSYLIPDTSKGNMRTF